MRHLITDDEPPPVRIERSQGPSAFFITCDHAGNALPRRLGDLGLSSAELVSHVAWDIGAAAVARHLSALLDACVVLQTYSRLVIDANRPPGTPQSILTRSERTQIPGNEGLSPNDARVRADEVFWPYHACIRQQLDHRQRDARATVLVSVHSFTPVFLERARPWHIGVLYQRDTRLAHALLALLRKEPGLVVGDNEPYSVSDETDYTLVVHGENRGLPHVELEIRQDLISDEAGQIAWAERLAPLLRAAYGNVAAL
jgi:predicted N-formylglutamate amidohydrolase